MMLIRSIIVIGMSILASSCASLHQAAYDNNIKAIQKAANSPRTDVHELFYTSRLLGKVTPLHYSAQYGSPEAIELWLGAGAQIDFPSKPTGFTPLHVAIIHGRFANVETFIKHGAKLNGLKTDLKSLYGNCKSDSCILYKSRDGFSALHLAAFYKQPTITKLLLDNGADISAKSKLGNTPLHAAFFTQDNQGTIEILLNAGSDPYAENDDGEIPVVAGATYQEIEQKVAKAEARRKAILAAAQAIAGIASAIQSISSLNQGMNASNVSNVSNISNMKNVKPSSYWRDYHGHWHGPGLVSDPITHPVE
jgi:ankyrin repeat protein